MTQAHSPSRGIMSGKQLRLIVVLAFVLVAVLALRMRSGSSSVAGRSAESADGNDQESDEKEQLLPHRTGLEKSDQKSERENHISIDLAYAWNLNPFRGSPAEATEISSELSQTEQPALGRPETGTSLESRDGGTKVLRVDQESGSFRVSAIMGTGSRRTALVDGRVVRKGDLLDGKLQVVAIFSDRVELGAAPEPE